eukprot:983991-Alexandrium_andersonii.AAC.1
MLCWPSSARMLSCSSGSRRKATAGWLAPPDAADHAPAPRGGCCDRPDRPDRRAHVQLVAGRAAW